MPDSLLITVLFTVTYSPTLILADCSEQEFQEVRNKYEGCANQKIETITDKLEDGLPNRLLSAIPISDLGESLDSRHLSESFNAGLSKMKG